MPLCRLEVSPGGLGLGAASQKDDLTGEALSAGAGFALFSWMADVLVSAMKGLLFPRRHLDVMFSDLKGL